MMMAVDMEMETSLMGSLLKFLSNIEHRAFLLSNQGRNMLYICLLFATMANQKEMGVCVIVKTAGWVICNVSSCEFIDTSVNIHNWCF